MESLGRSMGKLLIPMSDYNRIHQVAHGVMKDVGTAEKACMFFSAFGALVLNKYYKIKARAVAGGFALCTGRTGDVPNVAFFGQMENGKLISSSDGYHMWVQTETHIVDFMAPIFREAFSSVSPDNDLPRKMLQRQFATEAQGVNELNEAGDFITLPDPELTDERVDRLMNQATAIDLLQIADAWFGSRLSKQRETFAMQDNRGEVIKLKLANTAAVGSW